MALQPPTPLANASQDRGARKILGDAQTLVQQRGGCCVLQQGLFFGAQQGHGAEGGQRGLVEAAEDEFLFAGVGVDVTHRKDAGLRCPEVFGVCLLYTSPSPRDRQKSRMPSSA